MNSFDKASYAFWFSFQIRIKTSFFLSICIEVASEAVWLLFFHFGFLKSEDSVLFQSWMETLFAIHYAVKQHFSVSIVFSAMEIQQWSLLALPFGYLIRLSQILYEMYIFIGFYRWKRNVRGIFAGVSDISIITICLTLYSTALLSKHQIYST